MSTRRIAIPTGEITADHGTQYFTARDPGFCAEVSRWEAAGAAERWPLAGGDAWVGTPAMNQVIKQMAAPHDVRWSHKVERIAKADHGWMVSYSGGVSGPFDAAVLAVPAEQATPFLSLYDFSMARHAMLARSQPCWTVMLVFAEPLGVPHDIIREAGYLIWATRNSLKPGRAIANDPSECWVLQARGCWSAEHIEDEPEAVITALKASFGEALGIALPETVSATAHCWRYAMSQGLDIGALWNDELGLGACGDWLIGPRVECAWLSGRELARQMAGSAAQAD